ncbi:MAG: ribulose-phosphate 3-epimerase [Bacteroidetes bacterium]|nr:ribulose-phosphate 3-epimerase [Bacteroidota bacterium]
MSHLVAPSILSADFGNLQRDCEMINNSSADWFHVDVMDGVFVPNISFGFPVIKTIQKHAKKPLDVHLMIVDPDRYLQAFKDVGANVLTVHIEASKHLHRTIDAIKNLGMKAGVAINPHTSASLLIDTIADIDLVCVMSVNPGFGGQKFIENTFSKVHQLRDMIVSKKSKALIEIDGGVDLNNYTKLVNAGADVLVAGNTVFGSGDPVGTIEKLKKI